MPLDDVDLGHPSTSRWPSPNPGHLRKLTDERGLWEHARYSNSRPEHGYCIDDNARGLVVVCQQGGLADLASVYLKFVLDARVISGEFHNRRDANGVWTDTSGSDDSQGRAWWGLGVTARQGPEAWMRAAAIQEFDTCSVFSSPHLRSNAYAALGAAEVIESGEAPADAYVMLERSSAVLVEATRSSLLWPESRLTYDNARIPEALIAAGSALGDQRRTTLGIRLLDWLTTGETSEQRFSFTPVGGRSLSEQGPAFDQQPIEAWGMADACHRAWAITTDSKWKSFALLGADWLMGKNDAGVALYDPSTGGGFDGLTAEGANANQGAESTLAALGTLQIAARFQGGDPR